MFAKNDGIEEDDVMHLIDAGALSAYVAGAFGTISLVHPQRWWRRLERIVALSAVGVDLTAAEADGDLYRIAVGEGGAGPAAGETRWNDAEEEAAQVDAEKEAQTKARSTSGAPAPPPLPDLHRRDTRLTAGSYVLVKTDWKNWVPKYRARNMPRARAIAYASGLGYADLVVAWTRLCRPLPGETEAKLPSGSAWALSADRLQVADWSPESGNKRFLDALDRDASEALVEETTLCSVSEAVSRELVLLRDTKMIRDTPAHLRGKRLEQLRQANVHVYVWHRAELAARASDIAAPDDNVGAAVLREHDVMDPPSWEGSGVEAGTWDKCAVFRVDEGAVLAQLTGAA